jgi:hypothetical protein
VTTNLPQGPGLGIGAAEMAYLAQIGSLSKAELSKALDHQRKMERSEHRIRILGIVTALIVVLSFLGAAVYLTMNDHPSIGAVLGVAEVLALAFINSGRTHSLLHRQA